MSLYSSDISTPLPSLSGEFPSDDFELAMSPLSIHNPSFFVSHPPHLVGPTQFMLKSLVLLGEVITFIQRRPSPFGLNINKPFATLKPNET